MQAWEGKEALQFVSQHLYSFALPGTNQAEKAFPEQGRVSLWLHSSVYDAHTL